MCHQWPWVSPRWTDMWEFVSRINSTSSSFLCGDLASRSPDINRLLYLDNTFYWFTRVLLRARLCSVPKSTFKQPSNHCSLRLHIRIVFHSSNGLNHIQLQESFCEDSGTQRGLGAISWKPRGKFLIRDNTRDSYQQIIVCCCFCFHVVLDTRLAHYHSDTP